MYTLDGKHNLKLDSTNKEIHNKIMSSQCVKICTQTRLLKFAFWLTYNMKLLCFYKFQ